MIATIRRLSTLLLWRRSGRLSNTFWVLALAGIVGTGLMALVYWSIQGEHELLPTLMLAICPALLVMPFIMAVIAVALTTRYTGTSHYELIALTQMADWQLVYGFFVGILRRVQLYLALSLAIIPSLGLSIGYLIDRQSREYTVFRQGTATIQTLLYEPIHWERVIILTILMVLMFGIYWLYNWFGVALGMWLGMQLRRGMMASVLAPFVALISMIVGNCVCMSFVIVPLPFILATTSSRSDMPIIVAVVGGLGTIPFLLTGTVLSIAEPHARRQVE